MADQPGRERLGHVEAKGQKTRDAADDVAEHDADERHHDRVLHRHSQNEPDEDPGADDRCRKGKCSARPDRGIRHEEERDEDPELRRRNRGAGGRGNEFVSAELLHDEAGNAHAGPRAEDCKKPRQAGNQKKLKAFGVSRKERRERYVCGADKKRQETDDERKRQKDGG